MGCPEVEEPICRFWLLEISTCKIKSTFPPTFPKAKYLLYTVPLPSTGGRESGTSPRGPKVHGGAMLALCVVRLWVEP